MLLKDTTVLGASIWFGQPLHFKEFRDLCQNLYPGSQPSVKIIFISNENSLCQGVGKFSLYCDVKTRAGNAGRKFKLTYMYL